MTKAIQNLANFVLTPAPDVEVWNETGNMKHLIGQSFTLPLPPSSNRYWRKTRTGNVYLSEAAKKYISDVGVLYGSKALIDKNISITLKVFRKIKSGDLDNRIKILFDAMQGVVYKNDSQITEIHAYRFDDKSNPRVEVKIVELNA